MPPRDNAAVRAEFGRRIRQRRKAAGMPQQDLADACGRHHTTIGRIEAGGLSPEVGDLLDIADVLGTTVAELTDRL